MAIARLPWLNALAAWGTCGTWTSGLHFVEGGGVWEVGEPDEGDVAPCRKRFGLAVTRPAAFGVERRRGWVESSDSPPRAPDDMWDVGRVERLTMEKWRPPFDRTTRLRVRGYFATFRSGPPGRSSGVSYEMVESGEVIPLEGVQWADWDAEGRLLVATTDGKLQIRDAATDGMALRSEVALGSLTPNPSPPPDEAHRW